MNLWLSFQKAVSLCPEQEALVDGSKRFTYRQFGERVANVASTLASPGLEKGQVVALSAPNCHEFMEIYYACAITGIILQPIN